MMKRTNGTMNTWAKSHTKIFLLLEVLAFSVAALWVNVGRGDDSKTLRVFIFAGQSNMVGSDSKVADINRFPPFRGLEKSQPNVRFSYSIGRERQHESDGWDELKPVNNTVGPELSFAREVTRHIDAPIAIIKCAAGGTHLGGDWNPEEPAGFKMYPRALKLVRESLAEFDRQKISYRVEGFMWHQGENDMFNEDYMSNYGKNLRDYLARWRKDLNTPKLKFYIGELCTKTIWGMDLRPRMYAISQGQRFVTEADPLAEYIPTSHVGVEIGGGVGLHYHYGTLGQLEHGVNYANAYLRDAGAVSVSPSEAETTSNESVSFSYPAKSTVKLFVLAGHRNMEGERAFVQDLQTSKQFQHLLNEDRSIAFRYDLGGGYKVSNGWEFLRPAGLYDTFGPELSLADTLSKNLPNQPIAIAKFTHSGSQIIDWTPEGSVAKSRNLYPKFVDFVNSSLRQLESKLEAKGSRVELAGVFYHIGENDMSFHPFRKKAAERIQSLIQQSRVDIRSDLKWYLSQQPPTDHERVNQIDVTSEIAELASADENTVHIKVWDLPKQEKQLVLDTAGIVELGRVLANAFLNQRGN